MIGQTVRQIEITTLDIYEIPAKIILCPIIMTPRAVREENPTW